MTEGEGQESECDEPEALAHRKRAAMVRDLKAQVLTGRYRVSALDVADAIIATHRDMWLGEDP